MTQVLNDVLDGHPLHHVGVLAGPNIAKEVAAGEPALSVVAFPDLEIATALLPLFHTETFKVYAGDDVVGCEIAGAVNLSFRPNPTTRQQLSTRRDPPAGPRASSYRTGTWPMAPGSWRAISGRKTPIGLPRCSH